MLGKECLGISEFSLPPTGRVHCPEPRQVPDSCKRRRPRTAKACHETVSLVHIPTPVAAGPADHSCSGRKPWKGALACEVSKVLAARIMLTSQAPPAATIVLNILVGHLQTPAEGAQS